MVAERQRLVKNGAYVLRNEAFAKENLGLAKRNAHLAQGKGGVARQKVACVIGKEGGEEENEGDVYQNE